MNTIINLDSSQLERLSKVLGRHLSQSSQGKKIINLFQKDQEQGLESLLAYLNTRLPEDENLTQKIGESLGDEYSQQFNTIVARGGRVEEIINIGQLDNLEIRYYIFSDVRQVVTVLIGVVLIGGTIAFGVWWSRQPRRMHGDFNIAVAEFVQTGEGTPVAPIVSQRIHSFLDGQYNLGAFNVEVAHKNIGTITSAEEASRLAKKINAHLVIYGDVAILGKKASVYPQFYVLEPYQFNVGEMNGEHKLAPRASMSVDDIVNPPEPDPLVQSTKILTEFTKALVYLAAGTDTDFELARESIEKAIFEGENYGNFEGKEVLYLFASDISLRLDDLDQAQFFLDIAMSLNTNYGRGYIAQANIYYQRQDHYAAINKYEQAKELEKQPFGAYIIEKASLGIGNVCIVEFQLSMRTEPTDWTVATELANCALDNYQMVIDSQLQQKNPEPNLDEMAAWAYYYSGVVYQESDQFELAKDSLTQVFELTNNPELENKTKERIESLGTR